MTADDRKDAAPSRHQALQEIAARYGAASLENYAHIRSLAERIQAGFCAWLGPDDPPCVHLVPPTGDFSPRDFGSAAFSVSGGGFLPLEPIAFGLAVRVSDTGDWLRIVMHCMTEGAQMAVRIRDGDTFHLASPVQDSALEDLFAQLYGFAHNWFEQQVRLYESGDYGARGMGFELVHIDPLEDSGPPPPGAPVLEGG